MSFISGYVRCIVWNPIEGVKQKTEKKNVITNNFLQSSNLLNYKPNKGVLSGNNVFISVSTQTNNPVPSNHLIDDVFDNCTFVADSWSSTTDPAFGEKQGLLNPVGVARTFWTVALTNGALGNNVSATAYVKLDTECNQGATDFVTIFYRIQFNDSGMQGYVNPKRARVDFGKHLFDLEIPSSGLGFEIDKLSSNWSSPPDQVNYPYSDLSNYPAINLNLLANINSSPSNYDTSLSARVADHFKFRYVSSVGRDTWVGHILNTLLRGIAIENDLAYNIDKFDYPDEPFQTGFWHQAGASNPFYNPVSAGSSQGIITLSHQNSPTTTWNQIYPTLYKITIHTGGAIGISNYSISKRTHLGFEGNSYDSRVVISPFRNNDIQLFPGQHGYRKENNDILYWSDGIIVQYDQTGVTKLNLSNGEYQTWDTDTTPSLIATDIRQCCVDAENNLIYVGCRISGIHVIDTNANTISRPITTPCYGIDINPNVNTTNPSLVGKRKVFASLNGRLTSNDDWTADLGFDYDPNGDTATNWNECYYIRLDPESTDGNQKVGLVWNDTHSNSKAILWWDEANPGTTTTYSDNALPRWAAGFKCSPVGSYWVYSNVGLNFNSTNVNYSLNSPKQEYIEHYLYGGDNYYSTSFLPGTGLLIRNNLVTDKNNVTVTSFSLFATASYITAIGKGIALSSERLICVDPRWKNYDWNSGTSQWDESPNDGSDPSTTFKTTHNTTEDMIDNLSIQFTNGASEPHFAANEFFTQSLNYGLLKDNAVEITYKAAWYNKPVQFDGTASGTIPSGSPPSVLLPATSDPFFIRLETDSPELHHFQINSVDVVAIHTDGTPPGINEVTIYSDGTVVFNASDMGKSFTALKYAWVKE